MVFGAGHVRASRRSGWRPPSRSNARRPCVRVGQRLRARLAVFVSRRSVAVRVEAGPGRPALAQTLLLSPEDGDQRRTRWLVLAVQLVLGHGRAAYRWSLLVMGRGRAAGRGCVGSSWPGSCRGRAPCSKHTGNAKTTSGAKMSQWPPCRRVPRSPPVVLPSGQAGGASIRDFIKWHSGPPGGPFILGIKIEKSDV